MLKLDHLRLPVTDLAPRAADGRAPGRRGVRGLPAAGADAGHAGRVRLTYWGYGAELIDPDGYLIRLWDERSMKAH